MNILRTFYIPSHSGPVLEITESQRPNEVQITLGANSCILSRTSFEALASLAHYSTYGSDCIRWTPAPTSTTESGDPQ